MERWNDQQIDSSRSGLYSSAFIDDIARPRARDTKKPDERSGYSRELVFENVRVFDTLRSEMLDES